MKRIQFSLLFFIISLSLFSQIDTRFWFVAPEEAFGHGDRPIRMVISTMTDPANISLTMPANPAFLPINQPIAANAVLIIDLTTWINDIENNPPDVVLNKGLLLTSDVKISAYFEVAHNNNPGISTLKGNNALGKDFYIVSQNNYPNIYGNESIEIVATEDNTTVEITVTDDVIGPHAAGSTFSVTLNKGQTYSVRAVSTAATRSLKGSHVTSTKPIAVTWNDDSIQTGGFDIVVDQTVPIYILGNEYIAIKGLADNTSGDNDERVYILATEDNTEVRLNGNPTPVYTLSKAEQYPYQIPPADPTVYIVTTKPVYVLHLSGHPGEAGGSILPQIYCTGSRQIGFNRSSDLPFALMILTRNGNQGAFTLNGSTTTIQASDFAVVPGTNNDWVYMCKPMSTTEVPTGSNIITNSLGKFHLGILNKLGGSSEYGYFSDFASLNIGSDNTICPGASQTLDGGANQTSYDWKKKDLPYTLNTWTTVGTNRFYTVSDSGTYACVTNGDFCTLHDTIWIHYHPIIPVVMSSIPPAVGQNVSVCQGEYATLGVTGTYAQYLWSTGETTPTIQVNVAGNYSVIVTDNNGCNNTGNLNLILNPLPTPAITGPDAACAGSAGHIYSGDAGMSNYTWAIPTGGSFVSGPGPNQITVSWSAAGTQQVNLLYTDQNGCTAQVPGVKQVTVNPLPTPMISGPATQVCAYSTQIYTTPLTAGNTYVWNPGPGNTVIGGQNTYQATVLFGPAGTAQIQVTETSGATGCTAPALPYTVTIDPYPGLAGSISGTAAVCETWSNVSFSTTPIANASSYSWSYTGTGAVITGSGTTVTVNFSANATNGNLLVKGVNYCGDGPLSTPFPVVVHALPQVSFQNCFDAITIATARPFKLKGGHPAGGSFSGPGVSLAGGFYWFDPVVANQSPGGNMKTITYSYTNLNACENTAIQVIQVRPTTAFTCGGTLTDPRDQQTYPTFSLPNGKCWMAKNLNYGTFIPGNLSSTDNCLTEKYCENNQAGNCAGTGGFYAWDEMMNHENSPAVQGICPPGWHVPTISEWDELIAFNNGNSLAGSFLRDPFLLNGFHGLLSGLFYLNSNWMFGSDPLKGAMYWTSQNSGISRALAHGVNSVAKSVSLYPSSRANAFNVRCVRD